MNSDFEVEKRLSLKDSRDRTLDLRLNYMYAKIFLFLIFSAGLLSYRRYPNSGGAFKVQIYTPFLVINKTGQPFSIKTARANFGSQSVAGETDPGELVLYRGNFMHATCILN
jgi:vacuolar protein sorting-associated protein 13A/C